MSFDRYAEDREALLARLVGEARARCPSTLR